jgi:ABC-type nickel/cobalt efflux system permease component RcnA
MLNSESLARVVLGLFLGGTGFLGAYMIWRALRDLAAERQAAPDHKPEHRANR